MLPVMMHLSLGVWKPAADLHAPAPLLFAQLRKLVFGVGVRTILPARPKAEINEKSVFTPFSPRHPACQAARRKDGVPDQSGTKS